MRYKLISTLLIGAILIPSVCGCSRDEETVSSVVCTESTTAEETGTETEDSDADITDGALEVAYEFASGAASCDLAAMEEVCDDGFSAMWDLWRYYLSFQDDDSTFAEDRCEALRAIKDTIYYTIDDDSLVVEYGQVYVDATFYIADYETAYENAASGTLDEFLTELGSVDTIGMDVRICLREDDGELVCCNYRRTLNMLYDFAVDDQRFEHPIGDYVTGEIDWHYADSEIDGHASYEDPVYIQASIATDDSYEWGMNGVRCEVVYDGELVYTSYDNRYCVVGSGMVLQEDLVSRGFMLPAGEYEFTFYDRDDNVLASDTCTVVLTGYRPQIHVEWTDFDSSFMEEGDMHDMTAIMAELYADEMVVAAEDFTVEISYNGEVFYEETLSGDVQVFIRAGQDPYFPDDATGEFFAEGEYTITFYDQFGNVYGTDTRTITAS